MAWSPLPARPAQPPAEGTSLSDLWQAFRLRSKRRYFLLRGLRRARRDLTRLSPSPPDIRKDDILLFATLRNEAERLPGFLAHYRKLGVTRFLIVDNGSEDGSIAMLRSAPDVTLWQSHSSYKAARFGMDWMNGLLARYGHGHWCLTVDADELLIYPHWETRPLPALTAWLDTQGYQSFGAMMLDLYPKGALGEIPHGADPLDGLEWFDAGNYVMRRQMPLQSLWIQGGPRARNFFASDPRRAPTLGKVPLVKWSWRYAYVSSTHSLLPPRLNRTYDQTGGEAPSGVLLHTKFAATIVEKSRQERHRREHFANSALYEDYYQRLACQPNLWSSHSTRYQGWRQLEALGLMSRGGWV